LRRITMAVTPMIDASGWLGKYLEEGEVEADLLRAMLKAFAEAVMSAQASVQCGAGYGERSDERENSRNGYRHRRWDTRVGSIEPPWVHRRLCSPKETPTVPAPRKYDQETRDRAVRLFAAGTSRMSRR